MSKEYNYFKTWKKTARENNLLIGVSPYLSTPMLFDFSLLESLPITEKEKEFAKNKAVKEISFVYDSFFYHCDVDNFEWFRGCGKFQLYAVYNEKTGKRLYNIMRLSEIEHYHYDRNCVYDDYKVTKYTGTENPAAPAVDIEI